MEFSRAGTEEMCSCILRKKGWLCIYTIQNKLHIDQRLQNKPLKYQKPTQENAFIILGKKGLLTLMVQSHKIIDLMKTQTCQKSPKGPGVQPLGQTVWQFLKMLNTEIPYEPAIPALGLYPREMGTCRTTKKIYINVHSKIICNIQKVETTQLSINQDISVRQSIIQP